MCAHPNCLCFHFRKKKLTNHWRSFIRPVMWRCKWMELRIKEIDSQVSKYSRKLAAHDQGKHQGLEQFPSEGFCSKSLPFSSQSIRKKAMKRRKRKKVEDTTDVTSYMSQHNLFSYLGKTCIMVFDTLLFFPLLQLPQNTNKYLTLVLTSCRK